MKQKNSDDHPDVIENLQKLTPMQAPTRKSSSWRQASFFKVASFLSDPSPIIGYACHSLPNSLTHSCLVNLIDVTLACEDANSELVEVVTVGDYDAEDHVGNSLL